MKKLLTTGAAALVLSLALSAPAQAQVITAPCQLGEVTFMLSGATVGNAGQCAGWFRGNDSNQQRLVANALDGFGMTGPYTEIEKTEGRNWGVSEGPFGFQAPYSDFAVAVKAGNQFSLFYFAGTADAFRFDLGAIRNGGSHWSVYGGTTTAVPEPGTMLLLGTGLLGMAVVRRREETA